METYAKVKRSTDVPRELGKLWMDSARYRDLTTMKKLLASHPPMSLATYDGTNTSYGFIGNTALHWACANNHVAMAELILSITRSTVNTPNHGGSTALHSACAHGAVDCVVLLMKSGVNPAMVDCCNDTAEDVIPEGHRRILTPLLRSYDLARDMRLREPKDWTIAEMKQIVGTTSKVGRDYVERSDLVRYCERLLSDMKDAPMDDTARAAEAVEDASELEDDVVQANTAKEKGNELFKEGDYKGAIRMYTLALRIIPNDAVYLSNRCASYLKLGMFDKALVDAQKTVALRPDWDKALFRLQAAQEGLAMTKQSTSAKTTELPTPSCPPPQGEKKPWFDCILCENRTRDSAQTLCCRRALCGTCLKRSQVCPFSCGK